MKYGVGIDISKGKSTVAIVNEEKKLIEKVFEVTHDVEGMNILEEKLKNFPKEKIKIVMEATGRYHMSVYSYLLEKEYFVVAHNPFLIKKYLDQGIRKVKTDKKDAIKIGQYVIDKWDILSLESKNSEEYNKLKFLSRQYSSQISIETKQKVDFSNLCDVIFPGYADMLEKDNYVIGLKIFKKYMDVEEIKKISVNEFWKEVVKIVDKKQIRAAMTLAQKIYSHVHHVIPAQKIDSGMKTVIVRCIDNLLNTIDTTNTIIAEMEKIAITLPEYEEIIKMPGVGKKLSVQLIAEIGDIRRFKNAGSLIAYAGLDAPPYESGQYIAVERHISKRGNRYLRKVAYEVIRGISMRKNEEVNIYQYIIKKELEGKKKKVAKIAGENKFLRQYYGIVKRKYKEIGIL